MSKPNSNIPEEMLSAYLDGEVTPAQAHEIEAALAEDAAMRGLLADLRRIREEIRSLPQHQLPRDFAAQVTDKCREASPGRVVRTEPRQTDSTHRRTIMAVVATAAMILVALWGIRPGGSSFVAKTGEVATNSQPEASVPMTDMDMNEFADASKLAGGLKPQIGQADGAVSASPLSESFSGGGTPADKLMHIREPFGQGDRFDGAVHLSLTAEQLASSEARGLARVRDFNQPLSSRNELARSEERSDMMAFYRKGISIPDDAELFSISGTREEIKAAMLALDSSGSEIAWFEPSTRLPAAQTGDSDDVRSDRSTQPRHQTLATQDEPSASAIRSEQTVSPAGAQTVMQRQAPNRSEARLRAASANQRSLEKDDFAGRQLRILIIVQPPQPATEQTSAD